MGRILIIEDDVTHANLMEIALRNLNHEIYFAADAVEGLEIAHEIMPDLIYMDLSLPHMDGLKAIEIIRHDADLCHIPVFLITATRTIEVSKLAEDVGADAYITKPFDIKSLRQQTMEIIG